MNVFTYLSHLVTTLCLEFEAENNFGSREYWVTSGSIWGSWLCAQEIFQAGSGDHLWYNPGLCSNPDWSHVRQMPYPLYYDGGPGRNFLQNFEGIVKLSIVFAVSVEMSKSI